MKSVLLSIQPKWCKLIFSGEKTIEVRKTAPKLETPFKVYVYCTKERMTRVPSMYAYLHKNEPGACAEYGTIETWGEIGDVIVNPHLASKHVSFGMHGKVIGSFVCDKVYKIVPDGGYIDDDMLSETCLGRGYLTGYGLGYTLYGWHITDLKIYDEPKELGEFRQACKIFSKRVCGLKALCGRQKGICDGTKNITRPPQSWQYVEEKSDVQRM